AADRAGPGHSSRRGEGTRAGLRPLSWPAPGWRPIMRRALLPKLIFIAALAASCAISTPALARSSGPGGLLGLVTAPLRILGQGAVGHRHASRHHRAEPA